MQHPRGVQIRARFPPCSLPVDFKLLQVECQRNPPKPSSQPFELCYVSKSKGTSRATSGCGARILTTRTGGSFFFSFLGCLSGHAQVSFYGGIIAHEIVRLIIHHAKVEISPGNFLKIDSTHTKNKGPKGWLVAQQITNIFSKNG